jgi:hypothetical protein
MALNRYADDLADAVNKREKDLLDQLCGGRNTIVDDLEFRAERRLRLVAGDESGVLADIGPYFRRQQTRRLVLLGEPGAGKTVTVVHLLLDQLEYRRKLTDAEHHDEPVPVRVNAAGWDGSADFTKWLARQLTIDYGLNPRVALAMVKNDSILPLLDGLDEMDPPDPDAPPDRACAALERLNRSPWQNRAVVVACRSPVYKAIRDLHPDAGLQFATTATLQPLSADDIYFYLEQYREGLGGGIDQAEWAPVTDQLDQADGVLAAALRTPWLLSLAATALKRGGHKTAVELAGCRDTAQIRDRLFASLIPAAVDAISEDGSTPTYSMENVQRWLRTLAQHLEQRRGGISCSTQIALDEVWKLAGARRCLALHVLVSGLVIGLAIGLLCRLVFGLPPLAHLFRPWVGRPLLGLFAGGLGLLFGLWSAFALWKRETDPKPAKPIRLFGWRIPGMPEMPEPGAPRRFAWRVPGRSRWRKALAVVLFFGLTGVPALASGLTTSGSELVLGAFAVASGIPIGLTIGLGTNAEDRLALGQDARRVIHDDLVAGLVFSVAWAGVLGLATGLAIALSMGRAHVLVFGLVGLAAGVVFGMSGLVSAVCGRYAIASLLFGVNGIFSRRPARFLEWARNSGLLRVTGIAYQFRHDTYQQWLITGGSSRNVTVRSDPAADARSG